MKSLTTIFACILASGGFAVTSLASEPSATLLASAASTTAATPAPVVTHDLGEIEVRELLTATLQREQAQAKGELELIFARPWATRTVPDEPITVKILELPLAGITPSFIVRFELVTPSRSLGTFQMPVTAHIWRDILVARTRLRRGQLLADADCGHERRDVLALRDTPVSDAADDTMLEVSREVAPGWPVYQRDVRSRTLVRRGQVIEAIVRDSAISASQKVEVLEDGAIHQQVRVRNLTSKREFRGKVQDEKTVLVSL